MMRAKCAAAAALMLTSVSALADETTYSFDSVTKISYGLSGMKITGVLVNDTVPTTTTAPVGGDSYHAYCADLARDMLRNPGMYIFNVTINVTVYPPPMGGTSTTLSNCSLELKP